MARSSFQLKRALYEHCPDFVKQTIGLIPFSWISGPVYRETIKADQLVDFAPPKQIEQIENEKLGEILRYATDQVPFYKPLRSTVEKHKPRDALKEFPTIDKDVVQARFDEFLSLEKDKLPHYETTTGGTSGNQLKIILNNDSHYRETGFIHRLWKRVGYSPRCRKATFRGQVFEVGDGEYWRTNPIYRELQFSTFHLSPDNIGRYVEELNHYRPQYLHGYPSVISTVANHILANGLKLTFSPRAALLGSEATIQQQRESIENGFGCRAYSWFGHSERLVLGGECEQNSTYHQIPDYGLLEILDGDRQVDFGEQGEIIGTTFWNRIMPLIRYRTGDYATRLENACECGRHHARFGAVQGRWNQEYLIGKSGAKVFSTALNMHGDAFNQVMRYQYIQDQVGALTIRIMPGPGFTESDKTQIQVEHEKRIGHDFNMKFEIVDNIDLTPRGKLLRVVQNIPAETG